MNLLSQKVTRQDSTSSLVQNTNLFHYPYIVSSSDSQPQNAHLTGWLLRFRVTSNLLIFVCLERFKKRSLTTSVLPIDEVEDFGGRKLEKENSYGEGEGPPGAFSQHFWCQVIFLNLSPLWQLDLLRRRA